MKTLKTLDERMKEMYGPGGRLFGLLRPSEANRLDPGGLQRMLGRDVLNPDLTEADLAVVARRRARGIHWEMNRKVDDALEARLDWHERRAKSRPRRRDYLLACSMCGAWRIVDHDYDCRAHFGFLAYLAEGHSMACLTWDLNLRCKRYPKVDGDCETS